MEIEEVFNGKVFTRKHYDDLRKRLETALSLMKKLFPAILTELI